MRHNTVGTCDTRVRGGLPFALHKQCDSLHRRLSWACRGLMADFITYDECRMHRIPFHAAYRLVTGRCQATCAHILQALPDAEAYQPTNRAVSLLQLKRTLLCRSEQPEGGMKGVEMEVRCPALPVLCCLQLALPSAKAILQAYCVLVATFSYCPECSLAAVPASDVPMHCDVNTTYRNAAVSYPSL